ncbi:MAG: ABC transporter substrate-binding protein [Arcobacteraceae bacterium]|nr:ABC transporter substrate-binding protein [Arcobacteraceae bacterium]
MTKIIFTFLIFQVFLFANNNKNLQNISVQLLWKHQFEFAGFYIAKEKGFYEDAGLDVEIKEYQFGTNITDEVINGKSDFGVESASVVLDKMNGKDVYLLIATYQKSPFVLMSQKRDDIKTLQDLKNKKIMVTPNQVAMASLNAMLKINNIYHSDYISIPHTFDVFDITNGNADVMTTYLSNETFYLKEKGIEYTIFDPADYGFEFYSDILFTSKEFAINNPKVIDKFYEATLKGWEFAFNNVEQTAKIIYDKYNSQNKTLEHLIFEANELKKLAFVENSEFGKFKPEIIAQIAQTYQLLDLSKSTVDFADLIYPNAIYTGPKIDYSLVIKVGIGLFILLVALYFWNRKLSGLNKQIEQTSQKISILLDNAGQGFLTFDKSFKIDEQYSIECEKLLGNLIAKQDIADLLLHDTKTKVFFKNTINLAINEQNQIKRNSYISLLPQSIILNKKAIKLEYKILDSEYVMMILTNITSQKKLEKKVKKEQETLKMTVAIVSDIHIFYDITKEYREFLYNIDSIIDTTKSPKQNLELLYRTIHTFKGSFSQLYMSDIVEFLHNIENTLSEFAFDKNINNDTLKEFLKKYDFALNYNTTMQTIKEILGEEFVNSHNFLKIELSDIESLQEKISKVLSSHSETTPECEEILCQVQGFSNQKLYDLLKPYGKFSYNLAGRMGKEIYDFDIEGNREFGISKELKPFVKSLIHVFRNAVDHGIEIPEIRAELGKDEIGFIGCAFSFDDEYLSISIKDDGKGIDKQKIISKLNTIGIDTTNMSEEEILKSIFVQNLSTKDEVSDISGRGVGMSAVKVELDTIGGTVEIDTKENEGTTIKFIIPLKQG